MPRGSMTQKMQTVTTFLIGLRHRVIREQLAVHGLTDREIERGWRLVMAVGDDGRFAQAPSTAPLIAELDAWENLWFPIADAALRARLPEVHAVLFKNLKQSTGLEVVMGVRTFVDRVEVLEGEGRALLNARGLTSARLDEARALLGRIERADSTPLPSVADAANDEDAMWRWYKEWAAVARVAITDRRQRTALGFGRS